MKGINSIEAFKGASGSAIACAAICQFFVFAISIAILCINNYQLTDVSAVYSRPFELRSVSCAYSATSETPCNYLYAVGALGLFFSLLIGILQFAGVASGSIGAHISYVVVNFMNLGWWIAAAVYFTVKFNDLPSPSELGVAVDTGVPYNYMRAINALCFTALAFAALSAIASLSGLAAARKAQREDHDNYEAGKQTPTYNPAHSA